MTKHLLYSIPKQPMKDPEEKKETHEAEENLISTSKRTSSGKKNKTLPISSSFYFLEASEYIRSSECLEGKKFVWKSEGYGFAATHERSGRKKGNRDTMLYF